MCLKRTNSLTNWVSIHLPVTLDTNTRRKRRFHWRLMTWKISCSVVTRAGCQPDMFSYSLYISFRLCVLVFRFETVIFVTYCIAIGIDIVLRWFDWLRENHFKAYTILFHANFPQLNIYHRKWIWNNDSNSRLSIHTQCSYYYAN